MGLKIILKCTFVLFTLFHTSMTENEKTVKNFIERLDESTSFAFQNANSVDDIVSEPGCDCGQHAINCTMIDGRKVCTCEAGYVPGDYEMCTLVCSSQKDCHNGGFCVNSWCKCSPGTSGPFCDKVEGCQNLICGKDKTANCTYDQTNHVAYCKCYKDNEIFDYDDNTCKECNCNNCKKDSKEWCFTGALKCEFIRGEKTCTCQEPNYKYNPKIKACDWCLCGKDSESCHFDSDGNQVCNCKYGYQQNSLSCDKCDCGPGVCSFANYKKVCVCYAGHSEWNGQCKECDCTNEGKCIFDNAMRKTGCSCKPGFMDVNGKCKEEKDFYCGENNIFNYKSDSKNCTCPEGFQNVNGLCKDINECDDPHICHSYKTCINLVGSYECICKDGFKPSKDHLEICEDINECFNTSACPDSNTDCLNTVGSYQCVCKTGYCTMKEASSPVPCQDNSGWKLGYGLMMGIYFVATAGIMIFIYRKYVLQNSNSSR